MADQNRNAAANDCKRSSEIKSYVSRNLRGIRQMLLLSLFVLAALNFFVQEIDAQPMAPLLSESNLEQIQQLQQPLPPMTFLDHWQKRSLASGRWGLRPGKRSTGFNPVSLGTYNPYESSEAIANSSPQMYLLLTRN